MVGREGLRGGFEVGVWGPKRFWGGFGGSYGVLGGREGLGSPPPPQFPAPPPDSSLLSPELQRIFQRVQSGADFMPGWQAAVRPPPPPFWVQKTQFWV